MGRLRSQVTNGMTARRYPPATAPVPLPARFVRKVTQAPGAGSMTWVLFPALAGAVPDRPDAVRVGAERSSWEGLLAGAEAVAARIAGAPSWAVDAQPTLDTVTTVLACLLAGVPAVPVPPDAGPMEREHILADSAGAAGLSDAALILYTSGTTGPPKGAVLGRAAIAADLDALAEAWEWTSDDVLVHGLPLYHVHGLILGVLGALRVGCRLVHTGRPTPQAYAAAAGTLYFGVPTVWSRVVADPAAARALSGARLLVSGSAPLPAPVFAGLEALTGHRPIERYGMTETLITVSTRAAGPRRAGHVGVPVAGVRTRLVGDDGGAVAADGETIGELQVRGATLFDGYLNRPEATAAAYTGDGWFRTGDVATVDADGSHRIVGRASTDLIKSGGFRIGAGEVENALLAHPAVREAAVVGVPHADLGQEVVAYVVADAVQPDELIDFVATELSRHKRPRRVHLVEALPRNALGKVQKSLL
jgi:fatty acid CoA ligase FadD36